MYLPPTAAPTLGSEPGSLGLNVWMVGICSGLLFWPIGEFLLQENQKSTRLTDVSSVASSATSVAANAGEDTMLMSDWFPHDHPVK